MTPAGSTRNGITTSTLAAAAATPDVSFQFSKPDSFTGTLPTYKLKFTIPLVTLQCDGTDPGDVKCGDGRCGADVLVAMTLSLVAQIESTVLATKTGNCDSLTPGMS